MTTKYRKKLPHEIPAWVPEKTVYFITINCAERGNNYLCHKPVADLFYESPQFRQRQDKWWMYLCLLMPDHLHMLISFSRHESMRMLIGKWKEYIAKTSQVRWQRDFFDHRLRKDESFQEKAHYIRMNPVRKGLVSNPEEWPFVWDEKIFSEWDAMPR